MPGRLCGAKVTTWNETGLSGVDLNCLEWTLSELIWTGSALSARELVLVYL